MKFLVETNHKIATNPVAKAIARSKLTKVILSLKLRIYSARQGDPCGDLLNDVGFALAVIGLAGELDPAIGPEHRDVRVIRGALSAINQMSQRQKWDELQAPSLEMGIALAEELNRVIKPASILAAWGRMQEIK